MVSDETIRYWARQYNKDVGKEECNSFTEMFFIAGRDVGAYEFFYNDDFFVVYSVSPNMWGESTLFVTGVFIKPSKRNGSIFLKIQRKIRELAKEKKVKYTIQGSHFDDKYFKLLSSMGYKVSTMIKEET